MTRATIDGVLRGDSLNFMFSTITRYALCFPQLLCAQRIPTYMEASCSTILQVVDVEENVPKYEGPRAAVG